MSDEEETVFNNFCSQMVGKKKDMTVATRVKAFNKLSVEVKNYFIMLVHYMFKTIIVENNTFPNKMTTVYLEKAMNVLTKPTTSRTTGKTTFEWRKESGAKAKTKVPGIDIDGVIFAKNFLKFVNVHAETFKNFYAGTKPVRNNPNKLNEEDKADESQTKKLNESSVNFYKSLYKENPNSLLAMENLIKMGAYKNTSKREEIKKKFMNKGGKITKGGGGGGGRRKALYILNDEDDEELLNQLLNKKKEKQQVPSPVDTDNDEEEEEEEPKDEE